MRLVLASLSLAMGLAAQETPQDPQRPAATLVTPWASEVSNTSVPWPEYPRPQLRREAWLNLNGVWSYAIRPKERRVLEDPDGEILVPFAVESRLSFVRRSVPEGHVLLYRRSFDLPASYREGRVLLHFGAVDWKCEVRLNGQLVGTHVGGYDPFTFDVTQALSPDPEQVLDVVVEDPTDAGFQPRGKQVRNPHGIWYTSVTGIWQTVWLEPVPRRHVSSLHLVPDVAHSKVHVHAIVTGEGLEGSRLRVQVDDRKGSGVVEEDGTVSVSLELPEPRLWTPEDPHLYEVTVDWLGEDGEADRVTSYFGMRDVRLVRDERGHERIALNGEPRFLFGPLDQGFWPDGLYTAPTDAALRSDVERTKAMGFNLCRKHVKVEPARFYFWCDRLGLLVWQDMPNGDRHIGPNDPDIERSEESAACYRREYEAMVTSLRNHPSIVAWIPFNEGWGQFSTNEILAWAKELDPTRLVGGPSGWTDRGAGDFLDVHHYPGPGMPRPSAGRASVLGEFGGLGLPLEGHLWQSQRNWGYRTYHSVDELRRRYEELLLALHPMIGRGLAAAVYTQTTDVEGEVNGLLTYDRELVKCGMEWLSKVNARVYEPPPVVRVVCETSEEEAQTWRITEREPASDWTRPGFDDGSWREAPGGFGEPSTPGSRVRTRWKGEHLWLRRSFEVDREIQGPLLVRLHHDEDCEVYLNGELVLEREGYVTNYVDVPLSGVRLRQGRNTLAVHCRQTGGGQYVDVGLVEYESR